MESVDVALVGAGPIGLALAGLLARRGASVAVLESRGARSPHSRAIGLLPPSIDLLETLGLGADLKREAVAIVSGQVFYDAKPIGRLALPEPALSLPQARTEALLERRLATLAPGALRAGVRVERFEESASDVTVFSDAPAPLRARLVVGCDGADSLVRRSAGIAWQGAAYVDRYVMGDFEGDSGLGSDAALYFGPDGVVESFPLPEGRRRWVARCTGGDFDGGAPALVKTVRRRTGQRLAVDRCSWFSAFATGGYVAQTLRQGRLVLCGDAAHVVSPIGGQGMNLGFLGAAALAGAWEGTPDTVDRALKAQRSRAFRVRRRAEFNAAMGRPMASLDPRRVLMAAVLGLPPLSRWFARGFLLRDL